MVLQHEAVERHDRTSRAVQLELARLLALRLDVEVHHGHPALAGAIDCGVAALQQTPPRLEFALELRRAVEDRLSASSAVRRVVLGALVAAGLILTVMLVLIWGHYRSSEFSFLGFSLWELWWYAIAGAIGGVVSILLRIPDFAVISGATRTTQFYAGLFRPIVSGSFALLTFFILHSHLLGITVTPPTAADGSVDESVRNGFYLAISFLAGFSERLAPGLALRTEQAINPVGKTDADTA
jgi:hypothetical protein